MGHAQLSAPRLNRGLSALSITYLVLVAVVAAGFGYIYQAYTYGKEYTAAGVHAYPDSTGPDSTASGSAVTPQCEGRPGRVANHLPQATVTGIRFTVTTPSNYQASRRHPLLVVWAPSGINEKLSEKFTGLTHEATTQGFVVAHAQSVPLGLKVLLELSAIPAQVMATWCIDGGKVFYTGHSDGGTVSNALAIMPGRAANPTAIAPSAMGMQGADMAPYQCPPPIPVMLMHNQGDGHFPDYGVGVAQWWAKCNQCSDKTQASGYPGCVEYRGCAAGGQTLLCRADGNHAYWPGHEHRVIGFFAEVAKASK